MKEIIKDIKEVTGISDMLDYDEGMGYKIKTNKQDIYILVGESDSCCEQFGYLTCEDDLGYFLGAEITGISVVDTDRTKKALDKELRYGLDEGDSMFINIETSKGDLQLGVYNAHNGYYGHSAIIKSEQLTETVTI